MTKTSKLVALALVFTMLIGTFSSTSAFAMEIPTISSEAAFSKDGGIAIEPATLPTDINKRVASRVLPYSENRPEMITAIHTAFSRLTPTMTDIEKVKAMNDYIVETVTYDMDNFLAHTIPAADGTSYGGLVNKKAVCAGYSETFTLLMSCLGIPCETIISSEMNHAWNVVKVNGEWYHVDVTWNDAGSSSSYGCFLKSDDAISQTGQGYGLSKHGHYGFEDDPFLPKMTNTKYDNFNFWSATREELNQGIPAVTATITLDTTKYEAKVGSKYTFSAASNINEYSWATSSNESVVKVVESNQKEHNGKVYFTIQGVKPGSTVINVRSACGATASFPVTISK